MTENRREQRRFTRVAIDLPVEVHQGGSVWHQRLIDLSLGGAATDQPDLWDAQYNEPFTLIIHIDDSRQLFEQLVAITRAHYASGRVSQQDVLQAQLELSRLDDRATRIDEQRDVQRATLSRWIGDAARYGQV